MFKKIILFIFCFFILLFSCIHFFHVSKPENQITILLDWTPNTNHTGIFLASYLGYFKEEGLSVKIEQPPKESSTALLAAGKVEFAVAFQDFLAQAFTAENPLPIKVVAAIAQHNTSGIISRKSAGIHSFADLQSKNYATFDNPLELSLLKFCIEKNNGNFQNINLIHAQLDNITAAFNTNIDSAFGYYGIEKIITDYFGIDTNFLFFRDIDSSLDCYTPVLISNTNYINNNPTVIKKVLSALSKGYKFAANNPQQAADILVKCVPELNYDIVLKSQLYMSSLYLNNNKWGIIDSDRFNNYYDYLYENHIIHKSIPHNTAFTNKFLPE